MAASTDGGRTFQELSTRNSEYQFEHLWQLVASGDVYYMVTDLHYFVAYDQHANRGQILAYEARPARRRAAGQ